MRSVLIDLELGYPTNFCNSPLSPFSPDVIRYNGYDAWMGVGQTMQSQKLGSENHDEAPGLEFLQVFRLLRVHVVIETVSESSLGVGEHVYCTLSSRHTMATEVNTFCKVVLL